VKCDVELIHMTLVRLPDGREAQSAIPVAYLASLAYYAERAPAGAFVEIGVYRGDSALLLSTFDRELFLYDTFNGIPCKDELDTCSIGEFADTSYEAIVKLLPNATVVKGIFPESLVPMPPVAFVHADADQYQSTKAILEVMPPRMVRGGFMLFDDFGNPKCEGCTKAVSESPYRVLVMAESGKALIVV